MEKWNANAKIWFKAHKYWVLLVQVKQNTQIQCFLSVQIKQNTHIVFFFCASKSNRTTQIPSFLLCKSNNTRIPSFFFCASQTEHTNTEFSFFASQTEHTEYPFLGKSIRTQIQFSFCASQNVTLLHNSNESLEMWFLKRTTTASSCDLHEPCCSISRLPVHIFPLASHFSVTVLPPDAGIAELQPLSCAAVEKEWT